jgi:HEAT repeat protein
MSKMLLGGFGVLVVASSILFAQWRTPASPRVQAISASIEDLTSCDFQVREQALVNLRSFGPETAPVLTRTLHRRESPLTRKLVTFSRHLPFLKVRSVNNTGLREKAAEQLGQVSDPDAGTIQSLILALRDEEDSVVREVERALRRIGPRTVPQLTDALRHRDVRLRTGAAQILGDFGVSASSATPQLIARLKDKKEIVRAEAAKSLGEIGAMNAITPLTERLHDSSPAVRCAAADVLGLMGAKEAAAKLITRFSDRDTKVRIAAAKAVWLITHRAELSVPILVHTLKDREAAGHATFVLGEIGHDAVAAIPALIQTLQAERVYRPLRTPPSAAIALGRIGPAAVPALLPLLEDSRTHVRISAAITLGFIGTAAADAVPRLLPLLKDKDLEVRQAAAIALGSIEPKNPDIIPALKQLARDDDIFLASAASAMLRDVDPAAAQELRLE